MTEIYIREATGADLFLAYDCRYDPISMKNARETGETSIQDHMRWFWKTLKDDSVEVYIGEREEEGRFGRFDVGIIRFNYGDPTEIAIHLHPIIRGRGYGTKVLRKSIEKFCLKNPNEKVLMATIRPSNIASIRIFEKNGFKPNGELDPKDNGFDVYLLDLVEKIEKEVRKG
jgi:RimJ/RimL family protein N-acetyltransferase